MNFKTKIIKIEGKNLEVFFQNLITNDIKLLENNQALYSAILTPQGKFLYDFIVIKVKEFYLFEINEQDIDNFIELVKKYDIRESLKINIEKNITTHFILYKDASKETIKTIKSSSILKKNNYFIFSDPRKENFILRVWIFEKYIKSSLESLRTINNKVFDLERIKHTIPDSSIDLEKNRSFVLNYNFNELNAVSFSKGCYVGQESTSRQNYRGKIKYILKTLKILNHGSVPKTHENLFVNKQKIGVMKSKVDDYALALLRTDFVEENKEFSLDLYGTKAKIT